MVIFNYRGMRPSIGSRLDRQTYQSSREVKEMLISAEVLTAVYLDGDPVVHRVG
jgi:hypothetical protein